MSRNIRTLKGLRKHVGGVVTVITDDDLKFECDVLKDADGDLLLLTNSVLAKNAEYFWKTKDRPAKSVFKGYKYGHWCTSEHCITGQLKSVATKDTVKRHRKCSKASTKTGVTRAFLEDNIGRLFKGFSGDTEIVGVIVKRNWPSGAVSPTVLFNIVGEDKQRTGWYVTDDKETNKDLLENYPEYKYGWNVWDDNDGKPFTITEFVANPEAESTKSEEVTLPETTEIGEVQPVEWSIADVMKKLMDIEATLNKHFK